MSVQRIAIVGGGPIGLEAALYGRRLGYSVDLYERNAIGGNVAAWGFVRLFTPWRMVTTPLGLATLTESEHPVPSLWESPTGREFRERYLLPLARSRAMAGSLRIGLDVRSIRRELPSPSSPLSIVLSDAGGQSHIARADAVLDCSGTYNHHRWAGRGGVPAPGEKTLEARIWYHIPDILHEQRSRFAGRHTLLVGTGHSAATALVYLKQLAEQHPQTKVTWAIGRYGQALAAADEDPLPPRRRLVESVLAMTHAAPSWLDVRENAVIEKVRGQVDPQEPMAIRLREEGEAADLEVDELLALVGYSPDNSILEGLHVPEAAYAKSAAEPEAVLPHTADSTFFVLGAKSYGTSGNFLLPIGHRQIRDAYRLITKDASVDLYVQLGGSPGEADPGEE